MEKSEKLIGRFAPSPTGRMHAGNIFSCLVCWLIARKDDGKVVLRIEDLDAGRSRREYADGVMRDLEMLGLDWDGEPVYQSDREEAYRDAYATLEERGLLYPCYCTRADLHAASAPHAGEKPVYPGTCRTCSEGELASKRETALRQGREAAMRVRVPRKRYAFVDEIQGVYAQELESECGDFVVKRSDGSFAYQLAVVVDDAYQDVNLVVRGADLLSSTPQQLFLQDVMGYAHPRYGHVPLMMGDDGHRLSKRQADAGMERLLEEYGSPEGVLGHIAHIAGMVPEDMPMSAASLLRDANLDAIREVARIAWR